MNSVSQSTLVLSVASSIPHLLEIQAEQRANTAAVTAPERSPLSFRQLLLQVEQTVRSLNALGIGRNDRVGVVLPNGPEMASAFLAISSGATFAPLNPAYLTNEFEFCLSDLNAKALIVQSGIDSPARAVAQKHSIPVIELSPLVSAEAGLFSLSSNPQASPHHDGLAQAEDIALILYTSGTTAQPKMVPLTHANLLASAANIAATLRLTEADRCLNVMPLFHIHGLIGAVLSSVMAGASIVCTPGFDPEEFFAWLEQFRPTWYTAVPTMHQAVLSCATEHKGSLRHSSLRFIRSSSAALPLRVMQELEEVFHVPVIEAYGMTEASHQIASNPLPSGTRKARSVGLPVGVEVAVMDDEGNLLDAGKTGAIVIRGKTVTSGYGNSPESNDDNFKDGYFRTGDQGHLDKDGYLFITGRLKEIINRGGEKISPMEIDEVLKKHPSVLEAVTFPIPHPTLGQDVAVAVVLRAEESITGADIQCFLAARLAEFKIPRQVLIVNRIPKTPTGKIQRLDLAEKLGLVTNSKDTDTTKGDSARPRTASEEELSRIWSLVLGVQAGIHDNFFLLGGDSIQATRIISRVRESTGVDLPFATFFEAPTIAVISRIVEAAQQKSRSEKPLSLSTEEVGPLTHPQEALWFLDQLKPGDPAYNRPVFFRLKGNLELAVLERCLNEIVERHTILRTIFPAHDGTPHQRITLYEPFSLPVLDISALPETEQEAQVRILATEEARRSFDLARGPLIRCTLLRLKEDLHFVLVTMHHIVFDGWSVEIFLRELATLYQAFSAGLPSPLPALVVQYLDFARWQHESINDERVKTHVEYWKRKLEGGIPLLSLPTDRSRPRIQTFNGASLSLRLSEDLSQALKAVSREEEITLFMMLLAAFQVLLCRYSGREDIIVGTPFARRNHFMTEELIGLFINTLPLRTDLSGNPTFREFLARVRRTVIEAHAHQDIPFGKIVAELKISRDANRAAVHQILFQLRNYPSYVGPLGELLMEEYEPETGTSLCDLSLTISEEKNGLECSFHYSTDLFDASTIERMGAHFQQLLKGIVLDPGLKLSDLPLLTKAERERALVEWNNTKANYSQGKCIHQLFEAQVERTPDATAVVFQDSHLSYRELNQRANQLAHSLQRSGVGPETRVGIFLERSLDMLVTLMGVLKAGAAYVPLDRSYPPERLAYMLADIQAPLILTQSRLAPLLPATQARIFCLDAEETALARQRLTNPDSTITSDNLAYVIYTSGSTGQSKGVLLNHASLVNAYLAWEEAYQLRPVATVHLQMANFASDVFSGDWVRALCSGGKLVLCPAEFLLDVPQLYGLILREKVDCAEFVPVVMRNLLQYLEETSRALDFMRILVVASDIWYVEEYQKIQRFCGPSTRLINSYGLTEASIDSSYFAGDVSGLPLDRLVPIGRPFANTQIYILDRHLQLVPVGVPGELYIEGAGLAQGYLNRPDLTAERFIPSPFSSRSGSRLYKTGDLARYRPDGNIEFLGRTDYQLKIRGFRIEPGEIEVLLGQHPAVRQTVVVAREDVPGNKRLAAYVVPNQGFNPTVSELQNFLKQKLPPHMVPAAFVLLSALPLSSNGKVDRRALSAPDQYRPRLGNPFVAPRSSVEKALVKIWTKVVKVRRVGIHDNFFDLGGHSLLATQVISELRKTFHVELPLRALFENPTVAGLAMQIEAALEKTVVVSDEMADMLVHLESLSDEEAERLVADAGFKKI